MHRSRESGPGDKSHKIKLNKEGRKLPVGIRKVVRGSPQAVPPMGEAGRGADKAPLKVPGFGDAAAEVSGIVWAAQQPVTPPRAPTTHLCMGRGCLRSDVRTISWW